MSNVRVVTDSACDLTDAEASELGIEIVSLSIRFGSDEYIDRVDLSVEGFYDLLAKSDDLPETAAPSPGAFHEAFSRLTADGATDIICINLSAALSATMQSAQNAAKSFEGATVHVVDSNSITAGLGGMAQKAAEAAAAGQDAVSIIAMIEDMKSRTHVFGALDTLDNLKKGGRIGGAQAMLGGLLSIKPIIDLSSGTVEEAAKQRTRKKAMAWLRDKLLSYGEIENLAVMHGMAPDLDDFLAVLEPVIDLSEVRVSPIGPVIGTHGGPRVIGFAFQTKA